MVDLYTKEVAARALKDKTSATIVKAIEKEWISRKGSPHTILSDRDPSFITELNTEMYHAWGINKFTITAWHPQSNGEAERTVKTYKSMVKKYALTNKEWDTNLHWFTMDINSTIHEVTRETPFFLAHGRDMRLMIDTALLPVMPYSPPGVYAKHLLHQRLRIRKQVAEQQLKAKEKLEKQQDKIARKNPAKIGVGERVWLHVPTPIRDKDAPRWIGPFRVMEAPSDNTRVLDINDTRTYPLVHINRLKPFIDREALFPELPKADGPAINKDDTPQYAELLSRLTEERKGQEENRYEVESILDEAQSVGGQTMFLVKWMGYPRSAATWQSEDDLDQCADVLKEWRAEHASQMQPQRPGSKRRRTDDTSHEQEETSHTEQVQQPPKRKRGRPPKRKRGRPPKRTQQETRPSSSELAKHKANEHEQQQSTGPSPRGETRSETQRRDEEADKEATKATAKTDDETVRHAANRAEEIGRERLSRADPSPHGETRSAPQERRDEADARAPMPTAKTTTRDRNDAIPDDDDANVDEPQAKHKRPHTDEEDNTPRVARRRTGAIRRRRR